MIFTSQLVIGIVICSTGLGAALLALRFRMLVLKSVTSTGQDTDLIDGAKQNLFSAAVLGLVWLVFFLVGIVGIVGILLSTPDGTSNELPFLPQVLGWLLLLAIAGLDYMTVDAYLYTLRKWWESPISSQAARK